MNPTESLTAKLRMLDQRLRAKHVAAAAAAEDSSAAVQGFKKHADSGSRLRLKPLEDEEDLQAPE